MTNALHAYCIEKRVKMKNILHTYIIYIQAHAAEVSVGAIKMRATILLGPNLHSILLAWLS